MFGEIHTLRLVAQRDSGIILQEAPNMNSPVAGLRVAGIIFALFALVHGWRLFRGIDVVVGRHHIPSWPSVCGLLIAAALSLWMWKLASARR